MPLDSHLEHSLGQRLGYPQDTDVVRPGIHRISNFLKDSSPESQQIIHLLYYNVYDIIIPFPEVVHRMAIFGIVGIFW